jgi:hypothetical protein
MLMWVMVSNMNTLGDSGKWLGWWLEMLDVGLAWDDVLRTGLCNDHLGLTVQPWELYGLRSWLPLTVYNRIKLQVDMQGDKSPVVVKGPFFTLVVNPRYRICGTNVWCKSWSNKAEKYKSSRGETYASNLKEHLKNESNLLKTGGSKR